MGSYAQEPVEPVVLEGTANVADQLGVRFDERGLVPCVVQQQGTGEVLMMAWMNAESLALTDVVLVALSAGTLEQGRDKRERPACEAPAFRLRCRHAAGHC